jgi:beta-galactosidase
MMNKKIISILVFGASFICLMTACNSQQKAKAVSSTKTVNISDESEQVLSLNGNWKFNSFIGDGSSYRDIGVTKEDIVIDNTDKNLVQINGDWQVKNVPERASQMWGEDYLQRYYAELDPEVNVKFTFPKVAAGYYEHFIFYPFGITLHSKISVKHATGLDTQYISQRNRPGRWISLGIFKVDEHDQNYIEVNSVDKGTVVADAVMLRPINEDNYEQVLQQKQKAFVPSTLDNKWFDLKVPGHWGMLNEYSTYTGKAWYRKHFDLPSSWQLSANEKVRLKFDGVYHIAKVYLNGEYLGRHQGGFTPFEFEVSHLLKKGQANVLAVEADNSAIVGATWNWGGIIRDVSLVKTADVRVKYQYVHANPDLTNGNAELSLKVRVKNNSNKKRKLIYSGAVFNGFPVVMSNTNKDALTQISHAFEVPANQTIEFDLTTSLTKEQVRLWHFDDPNLYQFMGAITESGKLVHSKKERFGIRKIELTKSQMLLNGEPVRIGGFNRVSDHRYWGSSEPEALLEQDIKLMKDAGANFMRIMHGTQNKKLLELCDKYGILIVEEANIRELTNPEVVAPEYKIPKQWVSEMIERDINHPSIIGWSVGNELSEHYQYVETMLDYVKQELDPYRLAINVSNTGYRKPDTSENDPMGLSDLMMQNIYQNNPEETVLKPLYQRWPGKPLFISEYGLGRFTSESLDNDVPHFEQWHDMIRGRNTHVVGTAIWTYNDYRSGYSQSLESENRAWGVVNVWREKRKGFATVQKGLSPIRNFSLSQIEPDKGVAEVSFDVRAADDYPSYTMRDYQLIWQVLDKTGKLIEEQALGLELLTPTSGRWINQLNWDHRNDAASLIVQLVSKNGFVRYQHSHDFIVPDKPVITTAQSGVDNLGTAKVRVEIARAKTTSLSLGHYLKITRPNGQVISTKKTLDPYIDVDFPSGDASLNLELVAVNGAGESVGSTPIEVTSNSRLLPPVIWHVMSEDNKLIIGFDGKIEDKGYTLHYGYEPDKLNYTADTSGRGMIVADLPANQAANLKQVYFKLKRSTTDKQSQWTPIRNFTL